MGGISDRRPLSGAPARIEQTFAQDAVSDHARRPWKNHLHVLPPFTQSRMLLFLGFRGSPRATKHYSNSIITISGFDPSRSGGPHVPAPLEVKTCIFPTRLRPYTNCR
jgi:hypothetical protein